MFVHRAGFLDSLSGLQRSTQEMQGGPAADEHADVRQIIDQVSILQEWLHMRLKKQEDLLLYLCNACARTANGSVVGAMDSQPPDCKAVMLESKAAPTSDVACVRNALDESEKLLDEIALDESQKKVSDSATEQSQQGISENGESVEELVLPGAVPETVGSTKAIVHPSPDHKPSRTSLSESRPSSAEMQKRWNEQTDKPAKSRWRTSSVKSDLPETASDEYFTRLLEVFDQLDLDSSGGIDRSELIAAFDELGLPTAQAHSLFNAVDNTHNGVIDRKEWLRIIGEASRGSTDEEMKMLLKFLELLAARQRSQGRIYKSDRKRRPSCIIRHDSFARMCWDMLMMLLLFYISISMPYTLGFGTNETLETIDRVFDMFFCVDVVLNFRTSYVDADHSIIVDGCSIARRYLKSWFLLDFVSSVPFDLITAGLMPNLTPARLLKMGKIAKVMKLLRISKLLTVLAESELMEKIDELSTSRVHQTMFRIAKLTAMAILIAHWLACFGAAVDSKSLDVYFADEAEEPSSAAKYLALTYWAMTTLSTVGYGDITPKSDGERAYAMFAMVVGGALYGYVIGSVTSIVTDIDLNSRAFHDRMELVQSWLDCHSDIPQLLRRRLRKHFKRELASKSAMDDCSAVMDLSPELRAETAFFLVHTEVRKHPMFVNVPNSALAKVVEVLQKSHTNSHEYIVRCGDPGTAMHILVEGVARYDEGSRWQPASSTDEPGSSCGQVVPGDSFGEEILFGEEETYQYSVVTLTPCAFHSISEDGFQEKFQNLVELREFMRVAFLRSRGAKFPEIDGSAKEVENAHGSHRGSVSHQQGMLRQEPGRTAMKPTQNPHRMAFGKKRRL